MSVYSIAPVRFGGISNTTLTINNESPTVALETRTLYNSYQILWMGAFAVTNRRMHGKFTALAA